MVNQEYYHLGTAPSAIRELFAYGLQQASLLGPEHVYDYSLGNPSIPSPPAVADAIHSTLDTCAPIEVHGYSMAAGLESVRQKVADSMTRRFGMQIRPSNLFFTCGAAPGLIAAIKALTISPDSEIMVIAPFFPEYRPFVEANGAKLVVVPADTDTFQIPLSAVETQISANTQAIIINSPNNPSGTVYSRQTLQALSALLQRKNAEYGHPIYIIADEPYRELVYDGVEVPFLPSIYPNTIICYSYSKSLSLPGERIGYLCVPDCVQDGGDVSAAIAGAARIMGHVCPPSLMQRVITLCADEQPDLAAYAENRSLLYRALTDMGYDCVRPDGAFYLFVKAPNGDATAFSERAKLEHNLLIVPGNSFGCPDYFRLSYCVSNDMIHRSLPAFRAMMEKYR